MAEDRATSKEKPPPTLWDNLKALVYTMFSVPAAVLVLDKYDDRLGLSDLLKRIVRNFEAVTELIWAQVGRFVPLPPDFDAAFWSFFVLVLTPVVLELLRNALSAKKMKWGKPGFWGLASAIAFLGYAWAFALTAELGLAFLDTVTFLIIFMPMVLLSIIVIPAVLNSTSEDAPEWRTLLKMALFVVAFLAVARWSGVLSDWLFSGLYQRLGVAPASGPRDWAIGVSLALAAVFAFGNLRAPAFVFFWALGIWMVDLAASDLLPNVNEALDAVLPPESIEE